MRAVEAVYLALCVLAASVSAEDVKPPVAPPETAPHEHIAKPKGDEKKANDEPKKEGNPAGESVEIDPTEESSALKNAQNPPVPRAVYVPQNAAAPALPALPDIVLKAYVEAEGKPPSAMLEINGKAQQTVSEGMEFSVHSSDKQYLTLKVKKVSHDGVEIEVVQLKQTIRVK